MLKTELLRSWARTQSEVDSYCEARALDWGATDDPAICWHHPGAVVSVVIWGDEALVAEALWRLLMAERGGIGDLPGASYRRVG
jgi:hypothetical protein